MKKKIVRSLVMAILLVSCLSACAIKGETPPEVSVYSIHTEAQSKYLAGDYKLIKLYADGSAELSAPKLVEVKYPKEFSGETKVLMLSETSDFSKFIYTEITSSNLEFENLKVGTKYYYRVTGDDTTYDFTTEDVAPRNLLVDGVTNIRDLGGWHTENGSVKQGLLFRSSKFNQDESTAHIVTQEGVAILTNNLGIKTEIDLRKTEDNENGGISKSPLGKSVAYYSIPFKSGGNILVMNKDMLKEVFAVMGDASNYPIVFHCSIGTDRTGLIAFLVNGLLGVEEEDLYRDFLFSNFGEIGSMRTPSIIKTYMDTVGMAEGNKLSEKIYNYLVSVGVSSEDLDNLIKYMTEGIPGI